MKKLEMRNEPSLAIGALLVVVGGLFLLLQFANFNWTGRMWPFFIIVPGLLFFAAMAIGGRTTGVLAIPGSVITMIGLLLLYQNLFNHFESWAYAWALIPLAVGFGIALNGYWSERADLVKSGVGLMRIGAILFLIGFIFFEFVLKIGRFGHMLFGSIVGPLLLILIGSYFVWRHWQPSQATATFATPVEPVKPIESTPVNSVTDSPPPTQS
jgi:hypothetical protein